MTARIYIASKTVHAPRWQQLRDNGAPIISTWIDEAAPGETFDWSDLWTRCVREASTATALVAYVEKDEVLKGGFVEIGAALAHGVPVFATGDLQGSWVHHPRVLRCASFDEALNHAVHAAPIPAPQTVIDQPPYYNQHPCGFPAIDLLETLPFNLGTSLKYLWRADYKHSTPVDDLHKGRWYLARELHRWNTSADTDEWMFHHQLQASRSTALRVQHTGADLPISDVLHTLFQDGSPVSTLDLLDATLATYDSLFPRPSTGK